MHDRSINLLIKKLIVPVSALLHTAYNLTIFRCIFKNEMHDLL